MENQRYNDEIDLKQLGKKILALFNKNKKRYTILLILSLLMSGLYFLKTIITPSYKATVILKSKSIRFDQLNNFVAKFNGYIADSSINYIQPEIANYINKSSIARIDIIENEVKLKDKDLSFKLYTLNVVYNKVPSQFIINNISILTSGIQDYCIQDKETVENKIKLEKAIKEFDTLVKTSHEVGEKYKNNLNGVNSSQIMVMNDVYKGFGDIVNQKLMFEQELALLDKRNIIFESSPVVIKKSIERPYLIFVIGIMIWSFFVIAWILGEIVFGD